MKLAYPVATPDSNVPLSGLTGSFEENLDFINKIGYRGVELLVRDAGELELPYLKRVLSRYHLEAASFGTSPMLAQDKLNLLAKDRQLRELTFRRTIQLIELASHFQAPVSIGKLRGNLREEEGCTAGLRDEIFGRLCDYSERVGGFILMEPQKPDNVNNLNTIEESLEWLRNMNCGRLKLLVDTFHMDITEKDQANSIRLAKGQIGFVHLSDSGRKAPGCGSIDFTRIFQALRDIHYDGFLSPEIKQEPTGREAAQITIKNLKEAAE